MQDFRISFSQMGSGSSVHPFKSVKDYDDFLKRVDGFVAWTDTAITNMQKGILHNRVQPRVVMEKVIPQIKAMLVDSVTKSIFYNPVRNMPANFSESDKKRLTAAYIKAINEQINPAFTRLLSFIEKDYLPVTRQTVALSAVDQGAAEYAYLVKA